MLNLTREFNKCLGNKDLQTQQKYLLNNKLACTGYVNLSKIDKKIAGIDQNLKELSSWCKEANWFSKQEKMSSLIIYVKDLLTEIQVDLDNEKPKNKSQQVAHKILTSRLQSQGSQFQSLLSQYHQQIKTKESKKPQSGGLQAKRQMKILPQHGAQAKARDEVGELVFVQALERPVLKNQTVDQIEKILYDVSGLFKRFGTIVQQQQIMVERIDQNAEEALHDIEGAKEELTQVYDNVSSTRGLMLKIFFVILLFTTFYILFIM